MSVDAILRRQSVKQPIADGYIKSRYFILFNTERDPYDCYLHTNTLYDLLNCLRLNNLICDVMLNINNQLNINNNFL